MAQPQHRSKDNLQQSEYWMRTVSFAGLHRILKAVADFPTGLKASEINNLVLKNKISLTRRNSPPSPTTLYHYRNTLLHLRALKRDGRMLRINYDDPDVCKLLHQPAPANGDQSLCDAAKDPFAALVLKNEQCRSLFFDLFMPLDISSGTVSNFRQKGVPVKWTRHHSSHAGEVVFENNTTGYTARCVSPVSVTAILYGLRYWARDELGLIDEYCQQAGGDTIMFPLSHPEPFSTEIDSPVLRTVHLLLSLRTSREWTLFSISDLIARCCVEQRQPISVLFRAIDWILKKWPNHILLIPTSRALATLTATSPQRENLELRRYYRTSNGPYISHIRIHQEITIKSQEVTNKHVQYSGKTPA